MAAQQGHLVHRRQGGPDPLRGPSAHPGQVGEDHDELVDLRAQGQLWRKRPSAKRNSGMDPPMGGLGHRAWRDGKGGLRARADWGERFGTRGRDPPRLKIITQTENHSRKIRHPFGSSLQCVT